MNRNNSWKINCRAIWNYISDIPWESKEQNLSSEVNSSSTSQRIPPSILHFMEHDVLLLPVLQLMNPVHILLSFFFWDPLSCYLSMFIYVLHVVSFHQVSPQKNLECISLFCNTYYVPHSSLSPWYDQLNNVYWEVQLWNSSLCGLLQFPVCAPLLGTNIFLSTHI